MAFISKEDLFGMPVPEFGSVLKKRIAEAIDGAFVSDRLSSHKLREAEEAITSALGLTGWHPSEPLSYTRKASEAFASHRIDAEVSSSSCQRRLPRSIEQLAGQTA